MLTFNFTKFKYSLLCLTVIVVHRLTTAAYFIVHIGKLFH